MYHFEEYKRLHKMSMYMFANQVNAVLEDNKRFGVELTSDSLEASMLFVRLVFQPYNTTLNSIASIPVTYLVHSTTLSLSLLEGIDVSEDVLRLVYNMFQRYEIFEYHPRDLLNQGYCDKMDTFTVNLKSVGDTKFELHFSSYLSLFFGTYSDLLRVGVTLCNHTCGLSAKDCTELPRYLSSAVDAIAQMLVYYIVGIRVTRYLWFSAEDLLKIVKLLRVHTQGLTLTRVDDNAEFLNSKRTDVTNGTYQFSLATDFDSDSNDGEDLEEFMDLISAPFSSKQSLSTFCEKYLKMKGTWK